MRISISAAVIFLSYFLFACCAQKSASDMTSASLQSTENVRTMLVGNWLGEKSLKDGKSQRWLVTRKVDGTYIIQVMFKNSDGTVDSWSELGIWGIRTPIYFTAMRGRVVNQKVAPSDHTDPNLYDAYKIISVDPESFTYQSFNSGNVFTVKKVSDNFAL